MENNNNWISVGAKLPSDGENVQVTYIGCPDNVYYCDAFAYLQAGEWYWTLNDDKCNVPIVAWRKNCAPYDWRTSFRRNQAMDNNYFGVIQNIEEYFREHLPLYTVREVRRQTYNPQDDYLYMVSAEKEDGSFAVWTCWNESIKSLNRGHYNLSSLEACANLMEAYQNGSLYEESSTPMEVLKKLLLENDDHFQESFHELLYIKGFVAGISAQQENRWDRLTDTETKELLGEALTE